MMIPTTLNFDHKPNDSSYATTRNNDEQMKQQQRLIINQFLQPAITQFGAVADDVMLPTNPMLANFSAALMSPPTIALHHHLYALHLAKLADQFLTSSTTTSSHSAAAAASTRHFGAQHHHHPVFGYPVSSAMQAIFNERKIEVEKILEMRSTVQQQQQQRNPAPRPSTSCDHAISKSDMGESSPPWSSRDQVESYDGNLKFGVRRILSNAPSSGKPPPPPVTTPTIASSSPSLLHRSPMSYPSVSFPQHHNSHRNFAPSHWPASWLPVRNHVFGPIIGGHPYGGSPGSQRRGMLRRAVFSSRQRELLEKKFQQLKYIGKSERQKLATALGLKDSQVKIWFQNRRMKWRSSHEAKTSPTSSSSAPLTSASTPPTVLIKEEDEDPKSQ